ncbi:MAG: LexA family protein [Gallionellaceae bacterium]
MKKHNENFQIGLAQQPDFKQFAAQVLLPDIMMPLQLTPLHSHSISAGFPSPADDYIEDHLDLNQLLINNKSATFFLRVKGDSMINAGIHHGDIIVVDRSLQPAQRAIVVAVVDGELTVKRLLNGKGGAELHAENPNYAPICLQDGQELTIWGVVTSSVHQVK